MSSVRPKHNAEAIVKYTTAYPFRLPTGDIMVCVYCMTEFGDAADYRAHMEQDHKTFKVKHAFIHVNAEDYGKVDITDMRCRLCDTKYKKLESITAHLILDHAVNINLEVDMPLQPYLLDKGSYKCGVCEEAHLNFRQLGKHLSVHYHKFTCDVCGTSYKSNASLSRHKLLKHANKKYPCHKCLKGFDTSAQRREHLLSTKECWHYCCQVCGERFLSWRLKQDHLVQVHGKTNRTYPCKICGEDYQTSSSYRVHFMIAHSENPLQCSFCDMKFENKRRLDDHVVCHTKEKKFQCPHCPKNFSRKKSLWQHSWVHNEYKRFVCSICDKKFNQKVSLKGHLKSYHPETMSF